MDNIEKRILKIEDDLLSRERSVKRSMYGCVFLGLITSIFFFVMRDYASSKLLLFLSWQPGLYIGGYFWYRSKNRHIETIKYYRRMKPSE